VIAFHRVLIATAILLCAGFALWAQRVYQTEGGLLYQVLSATFGLATVGLTYYLANLRRFLGR
jgi:hypothetical protein